jgi:hypothetical protein
MTIFSQPQGAASGQIKAAVGTPVVLNLTTLVSGGTQNSFIAPTDFSIITTSDAVNKAITLPDPNKYGGTAGDSFLLVAGQVGTTVLIFPPTGGNIDGAGANASVNLAAGTTLTAYLQSFTATTSVWIGDGGS